MTSFVSYVLRGRIVAQTVITTNYVYQVGKDVQQYKQSDRDVWDTGTLIGSVALQTAALGVGTVATWYPAKKAAAVGWLATKSLRGAGALAGRAVMAVAPITAGYMIGATVGTGISYAIFGDDGAQTALGFYSMGILPGTEAPKLSTYSNLLRPSETSTPGPVDLFNQAWQGTKVLVNKILSDRPDMYTHPNPYMI